MKVSSFFIIACCCSFLAFVKPNHGNTEAEYCYSKGEAYEICRKCPLSETCEPDPAGCQCLGIRLDPNREGKYTGGPECNNGDQNQEPWCYVDSKSPCDDNEESYDNYVLDDFGDLKHAVGTLYESAKACASVTPEPAKLPFIPNVRLTEDILMDPFEKETWLECDKSCRSRPACGGWTFSGVTSECQLYTKFSCCQREVKRIIDTTALSGYSCQCWTSSQTCPKDCLRFLFPATKNPSNGDPSTTNDATVVITTISTRSRYVLSCIWMYKKFGRRRKHWRCVKPEQ